MPGPSAKAGIGRGIANIGRIISERDQRDRERRRQDELEERRRAMLRLQYGVRPGEPPTRERTIGPPTPTPTPETDFAPPEGPLTGEAPSIGLSAEPADVIGPADLDAPPVPTATVREPDPGYMEVEGLGGYVMTPEEEARREQERERTTAERQAGAIGAALAEDASPEDIGRGIVAGAPASIARRPEESSPWELREFGDRPYRVDPTAGVAEPIPGVDEPDVDLTGVDEERAGYIAASVLEDTAGDPDAALTEIRGRNYRPELASAVEEEVWRRASQRVGDEREWTPPPGEEFQFSTQATIAGSYPEAYRHWEETGEWDMSLFEDTEEDEGPSNLQRAGQWVGNVLLPGQPFGKEEAAAAEPDTLGTSTTGTGPDATVPEPDVAPTREPEPEPETTAAEPGDEGLALETDIREALQEGQTAQEILSELRSVGAPDHIIERAREILSELGENDDDNPTGNNPNGENEGRY